MMHIVHALPTDSLKFSDMNPPERVTTLPNVLKVTYVNSLAMTRRPLIVVTAPFPETTSP